MGDAIVALDNVTLRYGQRTAVEQLSLTVRAGEIVGLLGPNGSGKSSTLAAVAGLLEPAAGSVRIDGIVRRECPTDYARRVGFVPQEPALYEELSGRANLDFVASLYNLARRARRQRVDHLLHRVGLADRAFDRVATYSGGMVRRLNLAAALVHNPQVLLLDEPTAALDAAARDGFFELLDELRGEGKAILFATHHLEEAERWCDRVAVLRHGRLIASGAPGTIFRKRLESPVMVGVLREELSEPVEETIRQQLLDIDLEIVGRRIRIEAPDAELLGMALAVLGSEGAQFDALGTPPACLEHLAETPTSVLLGDSA
jgi:linearmycin/streptolysin S transport system ATP-binding protein